MHHRFFTFAILVSEAMASLVSRDNCGSGYTLCAPAGATSLTTPQIGSTEFLSLFTDIVSSSLPSSSSKRQALDTRTQTSLCCITSLSCLVVSKLALPFCYDRFTTNYFLPDASFGTVVGGAYTSSLGDTANLQTGDFKLNNGTTGNLYSANPTLKPNTATLPMPSQYTASGVGPAVAASSLGFKVTLTFTTTLPGSTITESIIPASTIPAYTSTQTIVLPTTITTSVSNSQLVSVVAVTSYSQVLVAASPVPATTISGSTVPPKTVVYVTTSNVAGAVSSSTSVSSSASAAATTFKSAGERSWKVGMVGILGGVIVGLGASLL